MRAIAFGFQRLCRFAPAEPYFVNRSVLVDNIALRAASYLARLVELELHMR